MIPSFIYLLQSHRLCSSSGVNPKRLCSSRLYLVLLVVARTKELNYTLISLAHTDLITAHRRPYGEAPPLLDCELQPPQGSISSGLADQPDCDGKSTCILLPMEVTVPHSPSVTLPQPCDGGSTLDLTCTLSPTPKLQACARTVSLLMSIE